MRYSHLVCLGDSWTYGTNLQENGQDFLTFPHLLSLRLGLPLVNLGRCSATNFNYKWLLTEWYNNNPDTQALVVVGVTSPLRLLIYDNQLEGFQQPMNYILQDQIAFPSVFGGQKKPGGYRGIQLADSWQPWKRIMFENPCAVAKNYIQYQLDDDYRDVEIASLWEIVMLNSLITLHQGKAVFWSNLWDFGLQNNSFFANSFANIDLVNQLQRLIPTDQLMTHPDADGHQKIFRDLFGHIELIFS